METSKDQAIAVESVKYRVKILAPSSCRNYQRRKILCSQIKNEAFKRFKSKKISKILIAPKFNEYIQKYGKFCIPKYFNICAKIFMEQLNYIILSLDNEL